MSRISCCFPLRTAYERTQAQVSATAKAALIKAIIGVSDHGGWAVFVAIGRDGTLLDRRRVELVDDSLPAIPHHHEGQMLPPDEAVALVERVRASAKKHAERALDAVVADVPGICGIALRECPELPPTIVERIKDHRARNVADWVMYRQVLAEAAAARGWSVYWFDAKKASAAPGVDVRSRVGPPWNSDHRLAMAGALAAWIALK